MLHTLELNYGMLSSHMNMFIWQGIILLFLIIFPLMVKFLLAACKERCEDNTCWYRRLEAAYGPLSELVEEGPLEARKRCCVTLTACCQGLCSVCLQFWGSGGCECRALLCSLGLLHTGVWSGAFLWVESLDHFCVPSPTACAEVKGGSVLTSPRQNAVESCGMSAGGRSAANGAIFLLWHLALRLHSHSMFCLGAPCNPSLSLAVSSGQPVSPSLSFPGLCLSLGSRWGHGTLGIVIGEWDSVLGKSFQ